MSEPVAQLDLDRAAVGAPLARVVEQVRHRARDPVGLAADERRLEVGLERHRRRRLAARPVDDRLDELVEPDVVELRIGAALAARELDHVRDECGELVELGDDVGPKRRELVGRQPIGLLERLDVRAQARDRRAQLVARVGDELALRLDGRSSASSVVLKLCASRASSSRPTTSIRSVTSGSAAIASVRRVKRAIGSSAVRATSAPSSAASAIPPTPTTTSATQHLVEHVVHLGERPRDLDRAVLADALGQHHQVDVVDRHVADVAPAAGLARSRARTARPAAPPSRRAAGRRRRPARSAARNPPAPPKRLLARRRPNVRAAGTPAGPGAASPSGAGALRGAGPRGAALARDRARPRPRRAGSSAPRSRRRPRPAMHRHGHRDAGDRRDPGAQAHSSRST